ncbi:MAG: peptidase M15, partial [Clostridia bacterium]|nr:peptidase M15 [Clostridia bacterium]
MNTYKKANRTQLSANFKSNEFACKGKGCCSTVLVDERLVEFCQKIRDHFGAAVTINSGYRCQKHNKAVGGASGSYHAK